MSIVKKHFTKIQVLLLYPLPSPYPTTCTEKMGGFKECICALFRPKFWVLNLYNNRLFMIFHLSTMQYRRCIFPLTIEDLPELMKILYYLVCPFFTQLLLHASSDAHISGASWFIDNSRVMALVLINNYE